MKVDSTIFIDEDSEVEHDQVHTTEMDPMHEVEGRKDRNSHMHEHIPRTRMQKIR